MNKTIWTADDNQMTFNIINYEKQKCEKDVNVPTIVCKIYWEFTRFHRKS